MDTKQKSRSEQERKRAAQSRNAKVPAGNRPQQRGSTARSAGTGKTAPQARRQRAPQQPTRRTPQETHNIAQPNAYAPHPMQEQVFKTEQKKQRVMNPEAVKRAEQRRKSAKRAKERKAEEAKRKKRPEVAYTQPVPVNLNQMLMKILIVNDDGIRSPSLLALAKWAQKRGEVTGWESRSWGL